MAGALFGGREGGAYLGGGPVRGGGGTKLNVRANGLNSKEAHEVTDGHNAHHSEDNATKKDPIIMEWSPSLQN